ncbi:tax1-binding protein 1 homolog B-like [Ischnura elegans]|uniref:tax1-binding protein 1 homolog B-like n=1 Tax=Ischnura elegans TaxID=197161 RepID=UPI001ED8826F|nr:tax1-binding protein 1 homolog B-like [Ischnura elegans]
MGENGLDATVGIQLDTNNAGRISLISQSQYAKVIFHDVWDWYPADADIVCRYTVTKGVVFHPNDKIALLPVGWNSALDDAILVIPVPDQQPSATEGSYQGKVLLKVQDIAKDSSEFYQICYVSHTQPGRAVVCGASAPFQFRSPQECEEWCEVEDAEDGIVIVRSRAALDQENLQKAIEKGEQLQQEKVKVEEQLQRITKELADSLLESGKLRTELEEMKAEGKKLEEKLGEMQDVQRYVVRLQGEARAIDSDRNETGNKLAHAQRHIEVLEATVSTLAADKEHMLGLLRSETQRGGDLSKRLEEVLVERETLKNEVVALQEEKVKALSKLSAALKEVISLKSAVAQEKNVSKEIESLREKLVLTEKKLEASQRQTAEVEAKYEEQSKLLKTEQEEVKRLKEQVAEMQLRLEMAAEEYRKVYAANVRAERKLSKQLHSRGRSDDSGGGSRTRQSTTSQPTPAGVTVPPTDGETGEPKVLKDKITPKGDGESSTASASSCNSADPSTGKVSDCGDKGIKMDKWHNLETLHDLNICFVCPICSVTFPPGESARFNVHFDNHLS